jgi:hypothetical protein
MSPTQLREIDRMIDEGQPVTQGVVPVLDPIAADYADLWFRLRGSTPADHPISLMSLALLVGRKELHWRLPVIHIMDRAYFDWQQDRRVVERKQAEAKQSRGKRS